MRNFKDFGIKSDIKSFEGDKIKIDRIMNKPIIVEDYKIVDSKFTEKGNGKCLHIQISIDNSKRLVFTGSANLMELIQQVPKEHFPFATIIIKENERYEFT